jgi:hypothetical protein
MKKAADMMPIPSDAPRVNGFARAISQQNDQKQYPNYRDPSRSCWFVRQLDGTDPVEWETAPVEAAKSDRVSLVWTGAMGYASMPSGKFTIHLNGKPVLDCDVSLQSKKWVSADGKSELIFDVRQANAEDASGIMFLTVPAAMLEPGKPARISVTGSRSNSNRWFMIFDYQDTLTHEGL